MVGKKYLVPKVVPIWGEETAGRMFVNVM